MVYQITISGLDGTEPSGKPSMKRENSLPGIGFWRSTPKSWERQVQISEPRRCLHECDEVWEIGHAGKGLEGREMGQPAGLHT